MRCWRCSPQQPRPALPVNSIRWSTSSSTRPPSNFTSPRLAGGDPEPLDPATVDQRRCETTAGVQIDPADMLAAVLTGHVRRVVFDAAGVVIDLGRRSRLFTGGARDAVLLGDRWCMWPGCDLRSGRCQTDHTTPWATDGPTRPDNGGTACGRHNRWKQRGYRTCARPHRALAHLPARRHRDRLPHAFVPGRGVAGSAKPLALAACSTRA